MRRFFRAPTRALPLAGFLVAVLISSAAASAAAGEEESRIFALTYPEGRAFTVDLGGTSRLPEASGVATVERKAGVTEVEVELLNVRSASSFGGDFNTYVLWGVYPDGKIENLGELVLDGNRSRLRASTPADTLGLLVTAEPHFLVEEPSRFVVLENLEPSVEASSLKASQLVYPSSERSYHYDRESLEGAPVDPREARSHLESARTAVDLAVRAGAERHAAEELARAREALSRAEAERRSDGDDDEIAYAHEAIRHALDAQRMARSAAFHSALREVRSANADRIEELESRIQAAESEAERNRLKAEQQALEASMEAKARRKAEEDARRSAERAAEAQDRAHTAEAERIAAEQAKIDAEREKLAAERARIEAEREAMEARQALRGALASVAAVSESARGLVVDLPGILFESGRATLRPEGREKLAKVSGALLLARGYRLSVEGHTDDVGAPELNLKLSEERANSVRDYLVEQGIPAESITIQAMGERDPAASNDTEEGRQRNRRVEIVVIEAPDFGLESDSR